MHHFPNHKLPQFLHKNCFEMTYITGTINFQSLFWLIAAAIFSVCRGVSYFVYRFDKYLREDVKSDTTSNLFINKVNSVNIKLGLCLVHTLTFVTSLLKKACIFCTAKLSNQPNNIRDEHGNFVVSFLQHRRHIHYMNYQRRSISLFPSV